MSLHRRLWLMLSLLGLGIALLAWLLWRLWGVAVPVGVNMALHPSTAATSGPVGGWVQASPEILKEVTPPSATMVHLEWPEVPLATIRQDAERFSHIELNTEESRRGFCEDLLGKAGYAHVVANRNVYAWKPGAGNKYILVGAHYDKAEGPSTGLLDNMLGCILVCRLAECLKERKTNYSYLLVLYTDEEKGRKIWSSLRDAPFLTVSDSDPCDPAYCVEIDYVGDKGLELGGRWIWGSADRPFIRWPGIKITSLMRGYPHLHTAGDRIENVDFDKVHLASQTVQWVIEGIEAGQGLRAPDTVFFDQKDKRPEWWHEDDK